MVKSQRDEVYEWKIKEVFINWMSKIIGHGQNELIYELHNKYFIETAHINVLFPN
jgi:hypothetical protein